MIITNYLTLNIKEDLNVIKNILTFEFLFRLYRKYTRKSKLVLAKDQHGFAI